MKNCLFNRDPYNGLLYSLKKWVTHAYSKQPCFCYCSFGYEYRASMPSTPGLAIVKDGWETIHQSSQSSISCWKAVSIILLAYLQVRIAKDRFFFLFLRIPKLPRKRIIHFRDSQFFKGPHPNHWLVPWLRDILRKLRTGLQNNPAKTLSLLGSAGQKLRGKRRFSRWTWYHEG